MRDWHEETSVSNKVGSGIGARWKGGWFCGMSLLPQQGGELISPIEASRVKERVVPFLCFSLFSVLRSLKQGGGNVQLSSPCAGLFVSPRTGENQTSF